MKKHLPITILIAVGILAILVVGYAYYQFQVEQKTFDWQKFAFVHQNKTPQVETIHEFTFDCPTGWKLQDNLNYNGKVKTKQCTINYNNKKSVSFDDGAIVSFGFIPNSVAESETEYFNNLVESRKTNYDSSKDYLNNKFVGKIAQNLYELSLIARIKTSDGYYEVEAWSVVSEQTKNDQENRKIMIDQIISSFKVIK